MITRVTVSLPAELAEQARRAVNSGAFSSVSAYVTAALKSYGSEQTLRELLDELVHQSGPPTAEERAWAQQALAPRPGPK